MHHEALMQRLGCHCHRRLAPMEKAPASSSRKVWTGKGRSGAANAMWGTQDAASRFLTSGAGLDLVWQRLLSSRPLLVVALCLAGGTTVLVAAEALRLPGPGSRGEEASVLTGRGEHILESAGRHAGLAPRAALRRPRRSL